MIPNIFISSTIKDLKYLRDAIRKTVVEIGYNPIMSDHGEIGYLPSFSAEESCYLAVKDCQLVIVILGKHYGSTGKNGLSITHNEYLTAKENKIPIVFLIDKEVLTYQKILKDNPSRKLKISEIDNPDLLFKLIDDFIHSEVNNGFLTYTESTDISQLVKKQIAHIIGKLLKSKIESERSKLEEIYKEISTIKHLLTSKSNTNELEDIKQYSIILEFFLVKKNEELQFTIEQALGSLEYAYKIIHVSKDFNDFIRKSKIDYKIDNKEVIIEKSRLSYVESFGYTGITAVDTYNYIDKEIIKEYGSAHGIIWAGKNKIKAEIIGDNYLKNSFNALKNYERQHRV